MQQQPTSSVPTKEAKQLITTVGEARTGKIIKQKFGATLLWRKEFHVQNGFFVLDMQAFICSHCNQLNKLQKYERRYVQLDTFCKHDVVCELCGKSSELKFSDGIDSVGGEPHQPKIKKRPSAIKVSVPSKRAAAQSKSSGKSNFYVSLKKKQ